jgi:superfamily II DNA or RNA helicase
MVDYIVYNGDRNERVVSELVKYYNNYNIVLSIRNDHLDIIQFMLQELGYSSHKLTGAESKKVRQQVLSDYEQGKIHYLLSNYQLSKEGLDLPIADTLHMVFPIGDKTTLIQSAGRVERLYNGKVSSRVVDYYDYNIPYMQRIYKQRLKILREIK